MTWYCKSNLLIEQEANSWERIERKKLGKAGIESTGVAGWPLRDSGLSTGCESATHEWMITENKND